MTGRGTGHAKSNSASENLAINDLVNLKPASATGTVNDVAISVHLRERLNNNVIYSSLGPNILVSLNPYKEISIYNEVQSNLYSVALEKGYSKPPHIFRTAANAYYEMISNGTNQTIFMLGESGSGKSEACKHIVRQYMNMGVCKNRKEVRLREKVLKAMLLLESFSSCQTTVNSNSSRYGKYMEIQFDSAGTFLGIQILDYLLEKTRVTSMPKGERNFHVFYALLAGASDEERQQWRLPDKKGIAKTFKFLLASNIDSDEHTYFRDIKLAMKYLGLNNKYQKHVFQILAAILQMGNLEFHDAPGKKEDAAEIKNNDLLVFVAELLGVDSEALISVMTTRTKLIRKELCTVFLNADQARIAVSSSCRGIYSLLFSWLIEYINTRCNGNGSENFSNCVGLVDFPGHENLAVNRFEQLMVNYTDVVLRDFYIKQTFELEISEYIKEGISESGRTSSSQSSFSSFVYPNDKDCLDLYAKAQRGVFSLLEDETIKMKGKGKDTHFLDNLAKVSKSDSSNKSAYSIEVSTVKKCFTVSHYFGSVTYEATKFVERNRDYLSSDLVNLIKGSSDVPASSNTFLAGLFASEKVLQVESHPRDKKTLVAAQQLKKPSRNPSIMRKKQSLPETPTLEDEAEANPTYIGQSTRAIQELLTILADSSLWFVLCIKPNNTQEPDVYNMECIQKQINGHALPELIKLRNTGFLYHYRYEDFSHDFKLIFANLGIENKEKQGVQALLSSLSLDSSTYALGNNKLFLKTVAWEKLMDTYMVEREKNGLTSLNNAGAGGKNYFEDERFSEHGSENSFTATEFSVSNNLLMFGKKRGLGASNSSAAHLINRGKGGDIEAGEFKLVEKSGDDVMSRSGSTLNLLGIATGDDKKLAGGPEAIVVNNGKGGQEEEEQKEITSQRRRWIKFTRFCTWWIPDRFIRWLGKKNPDVIQAWKEKVALCCIIFFLSCFLYFYIVAIPYILCPTKNILSIGDLQAAGAGAYYSIRGVLFTEEFILQFHAKSSVSQVTPFRAPADLGTLLGDPTKAEFHCAYWSGLAETDGRDCAKDQATGHSRPCTALVADTSNKGFAGFFGFSANEVATKTGGSDKWITVVDSSGDKLIFNMTTNIPSISGLTLSDNFINALSSITQFGVDQSSKFRYSGADKDIYCLKYAFLVGKVDNRNSPSCILSQGILIGSTALLAMVMVFKFLTAVQFGPTQYPEDLDKFVILQVPCYTENEASLRKTIDSLSVLKYDDKRKLLFIVADGMITGSGNDRPTPRIVLDILGHDPNVDPEPQSFVSIGDGNKQHNMGKVYSGLYECSGHRVPYVVIAKVGKPSERSRPGNRGKRDSQMILMKFLNKIHYGTPMNPMELDLYFHIQHVIGVDPSYYEYILMVDADTEVVPDSLNRLIAVMVHDSTVMGLCGETAISNERDNWVTMIQVYEYYISHYLAKSFESFFGTVTCLPGCFCMYRIKTPVKQKALLVDNIIIQEYSENTVDTLHKKNLLSLGEDRYLTTLMLKHFPDFRTRFTGDAKCLTVVPDRFPVLLSQRRRWINSTIHNLFELLLLDQLCGCCCFSMRFVVALDLFATLTMPASFLYLLYLIYASVQSQTAPIISLYLLAATYGMQIFIFVIRTQFQHIGWLVVSLLAMPLFSFYIPLYAFWNFDDFSWGNTRLVLGENGKAVHVADSPEFFDPETIPKMPWPEYEALRLGGHEIDFEKIKGDDSNSTTGTTTEKTNNNAFVRSSSANSLARFSETLMNNKADGADDPSAAANATAAAAVPGSMPTDEELIFQIKALLSTANLSTVTKKSIREKLSLAYQVDLTPKKEFINEIIEMVLQGRL